MLKHELIMGKFNFFLLTLLVQFISTNAISGEREVVFEKITVKNGLSHNRVQAIFKDSEDFLWFGTLEGLSKYDGSKMTVYRHDPNKANSIPDFLISCLYEDKDSNLWIGTGNGGICKYDRRKGIFASFSSSENTILEGSNDIRTISADKEGNIWIGMYGGGVSCFLKQKNTFVRFKNEASNTNSLCHNNVLSILADDNKIWIATDGGGLDVYNQKEKSFSHFTHTSINGSLSNNSVYSVFKDSKHRIWIGTDDGLNLFDPSTNSFKSYFHQENNPNSLCDNRIKSIAEDKLGRLWIATSHGLCALYLVGTAEPKFTNYFHDNSDSKTIGSDVLTSLYIDNNNILWIGTLDGGVNQAILEDKQFIHFKNNEKDPQSLSQNIVRSIYEDKDGNLWVGTDGGGLNLMRAGKNEFEHFNPTTQTHIINHNQILSIQQDSYGDMWFGTWEGGLNRLNYKDIKNPTDKFEHFYRDASNPQQTLAGNIVQDIFLDKDGRLWVGTESGLCLYDRGLNNFITLSSENDKPNQISDKRIQSNAILQDSKGTIWVGTWNGLNKMLENTTESEKTIDGIVVPPHSIAFKHFLHSANDSNSISDNRIISIFEDSRKNLWVGTYGKGLNRYLPETSSFENFTEKDGLPNDVIYSILEDNSQHLWLSTNNGLSCFSPNKKSFRNYDENDGLQSNYFYWGSSFKRRNGDLIFGGTNGFNTFNPEKLKDNTIIPTVYISKLLINNKTINYTEDGSPLKVPIWRTQELVLDYKNDQISFEFISLNYIHPEKNTYAYKLEGFNDEWINIGTSRSATYTNLSPGKYTLRVKASNNDNIWNEKGATLKIVITPPYWASWWFRTLMILALIAILTLLYYIKIRSIRKQHDTLKKMVDERTTELNGANSVLYNLNRELSEVNALLEETNEEISEQKELVISQRDEIAKKNNELELHHNHLEELVNNRTEELVAAKEKAEESERLKAAFLANMSHEIRTPLNAIVGFSNLLTIDNNTPEEISQFNDQISKNTESLLELIDDILDLSMIEAKQCKRNDKVFVVSDFIQSFFRYWNTHHNAENRVITLNYNVIEPDLKFFTDEHKLKQILGNFMSNACKFTESGSIEFGFEHKDENYLFYVKDTGIGIAQKNLDVIFDWFRKIDDDNTKLYRGSGLGLAISIRLAELLGGKIWVESELKKGSIFYLFLPESVAVN